MPTIELLKLSKPDPIDLFLIHGYSLPCPSNFSGKISMLVCNAKCKSARYFFLKLCMCLFLLYTVLIPCLAQQPENTSGQPDDKAAFTSLKKSLLVPGWGQFAEKHIIEGVLFLGAEVFSLYQIFRYNHKGNTYYSKYQVPTSVADALRYREKTEEFDKKRNIYILGAVAIWAVNLIDIYVIVKNKEKQKIKLQLQSVDKKSLVLSLHYSF